MNSNQQKISHSNEIKDLMINDLEVCEHDLLILSAFVKLESLKWIDQNIENLKKKCLLVRFTKSDVIFGSTDFGIINYCYENEWEIKFDLKLHSKIYIFDQKKFIIGSANVTQRGLSLTQNSNIETVVSGQLNKSDYEKIFQIYESATTFSRDLLNIMEIELSEVESNTSKEEEWSNEILTKINRPEKLILMKEDLLASNDFLKMTDEDKFLLGLENKKYLDKDLVLNHFLRSKIYSWLLLKLKESNQILYFGKLSQLLHEDIALNERIDRREIKIYAANLISWIIQLKFSDIVIDRPNYSQRIRLII